MPKSILYEESNYIKALKALPENTQNLKVHVVEVVALFDSSVTHQWRPYGNAYARLLEVKGSLVSYYETGKAAAEAVNQAKRNGGFGHVRVSRYNMPQAIADRMALDKVWIEREAGRMTSGQYKPLPWANEPWFSKRHASLNHFAHASEKKDGMISFTENSAKGAADVQTRMNPGRYLQNYYPEASSLPLVETGTAKVNGGAKNYHSALEHMCMMFADKFGESVKVEFAHTPDEMVKVYSHGPTSCMKGHGAVKVYAAGDLALAYLKDNDRITARCLVWPEKHAVGRCYGDASALLTRLGRLGYNTTNPDGSALRGARLLKIPSRIGYVMPYIDGHCRAHYHEDGKHLAIGRDNNLPGLGINAGYQNGFTYDPNNIVTCQNCKNAADGAAVRHIYVSERGPKGSGTFNTEVWCEACWSKDGAYYRCVASGCLFAPDMPYITLADKTPQGQEQRVQETYKMHYFQCPGNNGWYPNANRANGTYKDTGKYVSAVHVRDAKLVRDYTAIRYWPKDELPTPPPKNPQSQPEQAEYPTTATATFTYSYSNLTKGGF